jgi:hypothetical protein
MPCAANAFSDSTFPHSRPTLLYIHITNMGTRDPAAMIDAWCYMICTARLDCFPNLMHSDRAFLQQIEAEA